MFLNAILSIAALSGALPTTPLLADDSILTHPQSDHITCMDCGAEFSIGDKVMESFEDELREREGFTVRGHSLRVHGYCRACSKRRETRPQDDISISLLFIGVRRGISNNLIDPSGLEAARVRIHYPRDEFFVRFEVEMETGTPHVFDFHLGTELFGQELLVGRFETPLTRSRLMERERLFFLDRSLIGDTFHHKDGIQLRGRGDRVDWWLALQEGKILESGDYMSTARVAIHLLGAGASESTEGAWGSTGDATLTLAAGFQDDQNLSEGRRAAFEAFWAHSGNSASFEVLDNDADVGDASPWSATVTRMLTSELEVGLRFEDDELRERSTLALSKYLDTRSSRWSIELGQIRTMSSEYTNEFLSMGLSLSF